MISREVKWHVKQISSQFQVFMVFIIIEIVAFNNVKNYVPIKPRQIIVWQK